MENNTQKLPWAEPGPRSNGWRSPFWGQVVLTAPPRGLDQFQPGPVPADEGSPLTSSPNLKLLRMPKEGDMELKLKKYEISESLGPERGALSSLFSSLLMTRCTQEAYLHAAILPAHLQRQVTVLENVHIRVLGSPAWEENHPVMSGWTV